MRLNLVVAFFRLFAQNFFPLPSFLYKTLLGIACVVFSLIFFLSFVNFTWENVFISGCRVEHANVTAHYTLSFSHSLSVRERKTHQQIILDHFERLTH